MQTLKETVQEAQNKKVAIGHFNISNLEGLNAIALAAKELNLPVIIGLSEGEKKFVGAKMARDMVSSIRDFLNHPIYLNADHTYTVEAVKEAIDLGYDSVIFDGSKLSFEENVAKTSECVAYAKQSGREVLVEGELGYIGTSSKVLDQIPADVLLNAESLTSAEQAKQFCEQTKVNMLAPAVGNIHGMLRGGIDPALDIERIKQISQAVGLPLVLHGGSGNSEADFQNAIKSGVSIVHVNTELRVAYKKGIEEFLLKNPDEVAPYKIMTHSVENMRQVVLKKLKVFNFL